MSIQLGNGDVSVSDRWMKEDTAVSGVTGDGPSFTPEPIDDAGPAHKLEGDDDAALAGRLNGGSRSNSGVRAAIARMMICMLIALVLKIVVVIVWIVQIRLRNSPLHTAYLPDSIKSI